MKRSIAVALGMLLVLFSGQPGTSAPLTPESAARGVLERILPGESEHFLLQAIPQDQGRDVFELESAGGKTVIRGSSGVAIASGLNWY